MIYFDHNSTTSVHPAVAEVVNKSLIESWGNPSSTYSFGIKSKKVVEVAREQVASLCGASPEQVVFTSSATESNNTILQSSLLSSNNKKHIITSKVEHSSILNYCLHIEKYNGAKVDYLDVNSEGLFSIEDLKECLRKRPSLVSLMWVNNETGVVNPISKIVKICKEYGVPFHTDAVQAVSKLSIDFKTSEIDFLSLSGHKIGAPKGVGAMLIREPNEMIPFMHGGKQESGLRGGTENVAYIAALGKAAEIEQSYIAEKELKLKSLQNYFEQKLKSVIPSAIVHGQAAQRVSNTSNLHIPGIDGDATVTFLQSRGIFVSTGSACLEQAITPSHVILEMAGSHEIANESIRVSFGCENTMEEVDTLIDSLLEFKKIAY